MIVPLSDRPRWWQWPTVLSLDAPLILAAWQALVADAAGVTVGWPERVVLAASVWLAYTADRWIEAWRLDRVTVRTPRHRFHQRWRWPVAIAATAVLASAITIALTRLDRPDLGAGLVLTTAVLLYLLSHQWRHRHARWRVPKELCIAALLTAGVWLFLREAAGAHLAWPLTLFFLLCLSNTALISRWEREVDRRHGQSSLALDAPRIAALIGTLPWITLLASAGVLVLSAPAQQAPALCAGASALLLTCIDRLEPRAGWPVARVLADAALLTPIVALVMR